MKTNIFIITLAILISGCATQKPATISSNTTSGFSFEKKISESLQQKPIPFPKITPFDSNSEERNVYLTAFSKAWNFVVSGNTLHETIGVSIPKEFDESWNAGWKDGYKIASDRWVQELKLLQANQRKNSSS